MVVLYSLAIEYKLSPLFTVYVVMSLVVDGSLSLSPIFSVLLVKLFNLLISSTVVLFDNAIEYKLSPFFTIYVIPDLFLNY